MWICSLRNWFFNKIENAMNFYYSSDDNSRFHKKKKKITRTRQRTENEWTTKKKKLKTFTITQRLNNRSNSSQWLLARFVLFCGFFFLFFFNFIRFRCSYRPIPIPFRISMSMDSLCRTITHISSAYTHTHRDTSIISHTRTSVVL